MKDIEVKENYVFRTGFLVGKVSLYLVSCIPVHPQLVIHLLQGPLHFILAGLYVVHLSHEAIFHTIIDQINTLSSFPNLEEVSLQFMHFSSALCIIIISREVCIW